MYKLITLNIFISISYHINILMSYELIFNNMYYHIISIDFEIVIYIAYFV